MVALLGTLLYTVGKAVTASGGPRTSPTAGARPGDEPTATSTSDPTPTVAGTDAEEDVRIAGCAVDSVTSWPAARMEIVNGSGAAADYYVTVEFLDEDGTRVADGIVGVVGLAPGQTAKKKAQGLDTAPDDVKCRITEVHRTPSVG